MAIPGKEWLNLRNKMKIKKFVKLNPNKLKKAIFLILRGYGNSRKNSKLISNLLIEADLCGQNSHGVARLPLYIDRIEKKLLKVKPKIKIYNNNQATAQIDGNWGFGQIIADHAIKICIKKAIRHNISCVTIKNCNHIGRLSDYTSQASKKNLIGIGFANLHGTSFIVAPYGGIERKLPTNPIAISAPNQNTLKNFDLDMSTCSIAEGKLKINYLINQLAPKGVIQDSKGIDTRNVKNIYEKPKGSILPLGGIAGHKGFGLSLAVDILSGALSSAGCSSEKNNKRHGNSATFIAINIKKFGSLSLFKKNVNLLMKHVTSSKLKKGFKKILFPGEYETTNKLKNKKSGIKIDLNTYNKIKNIIFEKKINYNI